MTGTVPCFPDGCQGGHMAPHSYLTATARSPRREKPRPRTCFPLLCKGNYANSARLSASIRTHDLENIRLMTQRRTCSALHS